MGCHAQYIICRELAGRGQPPAGGEQLYCVFSYCYYFLKEKIISVIKLALPQLTDFVFFWFFSPSHWEGWGEGVNSCLVLCCWLGLTTTGYQLAPQNLKLRGARVSHASGEVQRAQSKLWEAGWHLWRCLSSLGEPAGWTGCQALNHCRLLKTPELYRKSSLSRVWATQQAESPQLQPAPTNWAAEGQEPARLGLDALLPSSCTARALIPQIPRPGWEVCLRFPERMITSAKHPPALWDEERYVIVR